MATQPLDASGQARTALHAIAKDYGAAALSNPEFMNSLLRDMIPDSPREASVLVAAAEANVAGILQERAAQHISATAAVAQATATLEERSALAPDACQWAARQLAEALGMPQETNPTPTPVTVPRPITVPPPTPPRKPTRKPARVARVAVGAAAAAMVVVYLVVAGTAHLPPFSRSPAAKHGFTPTAADRSLMGLIPNKLKAGRQCKAVRPLLGSMAEINCISPPTNTSADFVYYYLFASSAAMNSSYTLYLSQFAHTSENSGNCGNLTVFSPRCESVYGDRSPYTNGGRFVEYTPEGLPSVTWTVTTKKLLIETAGSDGNALLKWWVDPTQWLSGNL